jgi:hypothetical protein
MDVLKMDNLIDVTKNVFKLQIALNNYESSCIIDDDNGLNNIIKHDIVSENDVLNKMVNECDTVDNIDDLCIDELDAILSNVNNTMHDFTTFVNDLKYYIDFRKNKK